MTSLQLMMMSQSKQNRVPQVEVEVVCGDTSMADSYVGSLAKSDN